MKRLIHQSSAAVLLAFGLFLGSLSGCSSAGFSEPGEAKRIKTLGFDPIKFEIPQPEIWELPNGIRVFYYFNDELPQMRARLSIPGGSLYSKNEIPGLSGFTGSQMREGGIPGFPPDVLDKHLDSLAASIESSIGEEYGSVGCFSLVEDFPHVFDLFSRVVRTPSFTPARLEHSKKLAAEGIRRRRDDPETMAGLAFNMLVTGTGSPYYNPTTTGSLNQITTERVRAYHKNFIRPNGAKLAITGSMPRAEVEALINKHFADWKPVADPLPQLPELGKRAAPGIYVLERDFDQATIIMGHRGPPRYPEDLYEMLVYNNVFGHGGFGSALFREIRSRLGLAYSIYGALIPDVKEGTFQVIMQTRNQEVPKAISETILLIKKTISELPEAQAFKESKSSVERSFVFKFAEPDSIVDRAVNLELLGYPKDYDTRYLERIQRVTPEMVMNTGSRWIKPDELIIVVVGGVKAKQLSDSLGLPVYPLEFEELPAIGR